MNANSRVLLPDEDGWSAATSCRFPADGAECSISCTVLLREVLRVHTSIPDLTEIRSVAASAGSQLPAHGQRELFWGGQGLCGWGGNTPYHDVGSGGLAVSVCQSSSNCVRPSVRVEIYASVEFS